MREREHYLLPHNAYRLMEANLIMLVLQGEQKEEGAVAVEGEKAEVGEEELVDEEGNL